ncbi:oxidoreductase [Stenotrophomonas sp. 24(2023)]|uniref:oxidoreductase n=1 Tax=Stenotrophomonas sp. 24(2023) TaxID=3068324 RepID=UPI0027DEE487|nr:oxidoreductase [Stenotrophomonas sp. 24(2023)]WMJ70835.1 oxidoreductase [Stenotrophomonas sp. 24(2023)]
MSHNKVWFITGVSSGFGRELAIKALAAGDRVVGTLRNEAQRIAFEALHAGRAQGVLLDVTDEAAIAPIIDGVVAAHGRIDVLVNNAGYGMEGAVEETSMAQARRQFDVNFFGALAVTQAVLPVMRAQRSGHILNITSIGGLITFPSLGLYNASKHALEGLSDALAQEVAPLGIHVTAIEPGPFRTDWAGRSMEHAAVRIDDYHATAGAMTRSLEQRNGRQPGDPARAADAMLAVVASAQPPRRLLLGSIGFKQVGEVLAQRQAEMIRWADLSLSADFPPGE